MVFIRAIIDSLTGKLQPLNKFSNQTYQDLRILHIACGDCNGCALELQALKGAAYDIQESGISFVDHPANADLLLISGLLNRTMVPYIEKNWLLMKEPKAIIVMGTCAINHHIFESNYTVCENCVEGHECILEIEGCPPSPQKIMKNLMNLELNQNTGLFLKGCHSSSPQQESSGHQLSNDDNCDNLTV